LSNSRLPGGLSDFFILNLVFNNFNTLHNSVDVEQLKQEFDSVQKVVHLTEDQTPHHVASLLKEFFRELPDPLLTRDLYPAFIATAGNVICFNIKYYVIIM